MRHPDAAANFKTALLSSVSAVALLVANPALVSAADIGRPQILTKAPAPVHDSWTWWVEGGAARLEGDPGVAGLTNFDVDAKRWGWEGAIGLDYRSSITGWIFSGQFRYGRNGSASAGSNPSAVFLGGNFGTTPISVTGTNSASRKEQHWVADFMVGRDLGLGSGMSVAKFGVRVAELRGRTNGSAQWNQFGTPTNCIPTPASIVAYCASERRDYVQENKFIGIGPRAELNGQVPLLERWSLVYGVGVAGLFGQRKADQTATISQIAPTAIPTPSCVSGCPNLNVSSSNNGFVFNTDAMLGIAFAIGPNAQLMINYRFDGYWNALRGFDSNGNVTNLDRFYHGPMVRLTVRTP